MTNDDDYRPEHAGRKVLLEMIYDLTNPFLHSLLILSGQSSRILTCTELSGHWCLF